jgi:hypothetical protein
MQLLPPLFGCIRDGRKSACRLGLYSIMNAVPKEWIKHPPLPPQSPPGHIGSATVIVLMAVPTEPTASRTVNFTS